MPAPPEPLGLDAERRGDPEAGQTDGVLCGVLSVLLILSIWVTRGR
jgi:hypothetical protein